MGAIQRLQSNAAPDPEGDTNRPTVHQERWLGIIVLLHDPGASHQWMSGSLVAVVSSGLETLL
jgi:hypothetical protein